MDEFNIKAVVKFKDISGGCWYLLSNNEEYLPVNWENFADFKIQDLRVNCTLEKKVNSVTICNFGTTVEIKNIKKRKNIYVTLITALLIILPLISLIYSQIKSN